MLSRNNAKDFFFFQHLSDDALGRKTEWIIMYAGWDKAKHFYSNFSVLCCLAFFYKDSGSYTILFHLSLELSDLLTHLLWRLEFRHGSGFQSVHCVFILTGQGAFFVTETHQERANLAAKHVPPWEYVQSTDQEKIFSFVEHVCFPPPCLCSVLDFALSSVYQ